jgi:hypothetical protein
VLHRQCWPTRHYRPDQSTTAAAPFPNLARLRSCLTQLPARCCFADSPHRPWPRASSTPASARCASPHPAPLAARVHHARPAPALLAAPARTTPHRGHQAQPRPPRCTPLEKQPRAASADSPHAHGHPAVPAAPPRQCCPIHHGTAVLSTPALPPSAAFAQFSVQISPNFDTSFSPNFDNFPTPVCLQILTTFSKYST